MKRPLLLLPLLALATVPCLAQDPATNAAEEVDDLIREIDLRESRHPVKLDEHILDCFAAGTNAMSKGFNGTALTQFEEMERILSLVNGFPVAEKLADIREQARKLAEEIRQAGDPRHRLTGTVSKIVPNAMNDDFEDGEWMSYDLVSIQVEEVDSVPRQFQFDVLRDAGDSSITNLQPGARISFSMTMLPDDRLSAEFYIGALDDIKVLSPHPATPSPAEETHAEPEPRAASAGHRLDEVKELYATGEYAKARTRLEAVLKDEPGNERARSLLLRVVDRERREQEDDLRWQDLRRQAIKSVQPCRRPEGRDKAAREEDPMATPAMLSPAEETHAESAETAEPEPHAEPAP